MSSAKLHKVIIRYGPYLSCAVSEHREDYLQGLKTTLTEAGHTVLLEKSEDTDMVEIIVYNEIIYKCNIRSLVFGGDGQLDPRCKQVLHAISSIPCR